MIVDTVDTFDWDKDLARLATLPGWAEWEAYVSQFQGCDANATSAEKWSRIELIFDSNDNVNANGGENVNENCHE